MLEHMRRSTMHVDGAADAFPTALAGHFSDGELAVAENVLASMGKGREDILQLRFQRNQAHTSFALRRADIPPCCRHIALTCRC